MTERQSSTIAIRRGNTTLLTVPIEPGSTRKFALMQEDSITLAFQLEQPVHIAIGDYIDDELFGRFVVTKEQMPQYNAATAGYQYSIRFDAEYMTWGNRQFMLTITQNGQTTRRETQWCLTGTLEQQTDEILRNIECLGYTGYEISIEPTVALAAKVNLMTYDGTSILQAMNAIAEKWECEWWFEGKTLYFGKCQTNAAPITFRNGYNVEQMQISDNRSHYANRIYAFGSTDNIPSTYRRRLMLKITSATTEDDDITYYFTNPELSDAMFPAAKRIEAFIEREQLLREQYQPPTQFAAYKGESSDVVIENTAQYLISCPTIRFFNLSVRADKDLSQPATYDIGYNLFIALIMHDPEGHHPDYLMSSANYSGTFACSNSTATNYSIPSPDIPGTDGLVTTTIEAGRYELYIMCTARFTHPVTIPNNPNPSAKNGSPLIIQQGNAKGSVPIKVSHAEGKWRDAYIIVNPKGEPQFYPNGNPNRMSHAIAFCTAAGILTDPPAAFSWRDVIVVNPESETIYVPSAYYTSSFDDPSAISRIGQSRLQLPESTPGYIDTGAHSGLGVVEETVIFPDILPRCDLVVSAIETTRHTDHVEFEGEDITQDWQWTEYTLQLTLANGQPFPFEERYILPATKLQIQFTTDPSVVGEPSPTHCSLAGMTFEVHYEAGKYTIVRSDTYGALLPSEVLAPHVGDPCILIGWNPRAIQSLGLIEQAEQRLLAKAQEYAAAMEEGQFTFDCTMMSDFITGSIPKEGQRVTINHGSLKSPKTSRIIGYELKLDKPYDSPRYTVGETQAYSRLAKIEREINSK